jgi:hypothetical protein
MDDLDEAREEQQDFEVASYEQTSQLHVLRLLHEGLETISPLSSFPKHSFDSMMSFSSSVLS